MMEFSLWKKLRKRLRSKRHPMWMLGCITIVLFAGALYLSQIEQASAVSFEPADVNRIKQLLSEQNAYIGIDKEGNLNLYDGVPKKEKVVRTFFQLDVQHMESSLPQDKLDQLTRGIRLGDIDEYNSILSTFSDYAMEQNEKVMKPTY